MPLTAVLPGAQRTATVPMDTRTELNSRMGLMGCRAEAGMHQVTWRVPVLLEDMGPMALMMVRC